MGHEEIQTIVQAVGTGFLTDEFDASKLRYGKIIVMTDADVDGSHIRTLLLTLFYRKMPELVMRGYIYVAQPPLYKISKGKKERYVVSERERLEVIAELGLGTVKLVLSGSGETFEDARLRRLLDAINRVMALQAHMPAEGGVAFNDYLAEASTPDLELPAFWLVGDAGGGFVDTQIQMEARMEELRSRGPLIVYEGPESSCRREDADVEVYALHAGEEIAQELRRLVDFGVQPALFRQHDAPVCEVHDGADVLPQHSLAEAIDTIQRLCEKGLDTQRYKGLGEMDPPQLWESTMDPDRRTLCRVTVNDAQEADRIFTVLMGPNVEPRREFIEKHALEVTNLDY